MRDPCCSGGDVSHSAEVMFSYHSGALDGSAAYEATSSSGASIVASVSTYSCTLTSSTTTCLGPGLEVARASPPAARLGTPAAPRPRQRTEALRGTGSTHRCATAVRGRRRAGRDGRDVAAYSARSLSARMSLRRSTTPAVHPCPGWTIP